MDAVVLAGGRGLRLAGITPPFYKPLLPIDGVPLVTRAVNHAVVSDLIENIVVVVAPENALPICQVLPLHAGRSIYTVVQPTPLGPGDALRIGLQTAARSDDVLVLLADNVMTDAQVEDVIKLRGVSTKRYERHAAVRFTRWDRDKARWVEKVDVTSTQVDADDMVTCWVGPIVVNRTRALRTLHMMTSDTELLIGPYLSDILATAKHVHTDAYDIGTPEGWIK